jgi:predicted N-acetyltransferase YhbS
MMAIREARAVGIDAVELATELLHRVRRADPTAGIWEAADRQWWWRTPRSSDAIEQLFWVDDDGPVAAALLTEWGTGWGCDPIVVPNATAPPLATVWSRALELIDTLPATTVEVAVRDDDTELRTLLTRSGFTVTGDTSGDTWMAAADCPPLPGVPAGFRLIDRVMARHRPHPMRGRSGDAVETRLRETSLYDPALDLEMVAENGETAGYALFWYDAATGVGMLEPMRTEDAYQRRGLARVLLATGLNRLVGRGAERLKVAFATDAARDLYVGAGFRVGVMCEAFTRPSGSVECEREG